VVTVFVIAIEALSSLFLAAVPDARAAGAPIFQLMNGKVPEIVRMSKDNILVTSRIKVSEDGYFGANSTFAIFTFTQNLKLKKEETERDIWEIASVSFSDLVNERGYQDANGVTKSKIISPTTIDLRNNNNGGRDQRIALIDYSKLPKDSYLSTKVPCYLVHKPTSAYPARNYPISGWKSDSTCPGLRVGTDHRTPATAVASYVYSESVTVENYRLSSTSTDPRYSRDRISNWFAGKGTVNGIPIHITNRDPEDQGKPPYIEIPANGAGTNIAGSTNEYLKFKLTHVAGTYTNYTEAGTVIGAATGFALSAGTIGTLIGAGFGGWIGKNAGSNVSWSIWSAELKDGTEIKPLIIIGDNKGPNWEMYYVDADFAKTDPTSSGNNPLSVVVKDDGNDYGGSAGKDSFHELYRYLSDNPPKVGDDSCADGRGLTTGPKKEPKTLKDLDYHQVSALNSNCLDRETDGWAPFWGVTVSSEAGDAAACDIKSLFGGGVDTAFNETIKCLYDKIFKPIVGIAEEQLRKATEIDLYKTLVDPAGFVPRVWKLTRSLINILLVIALLVISFANITRFSLDTYTVKTALPKLILGVILANLSMLIIRLMTQLADQVTGLFSRDLAGLGDFPQLVTQAAAAVGLSGLGTIGGIFTGGLGYIVLFILAIIAFVLLLWLAFLLYFRLAAVYLLTILAPLTFVAYGIPGIGDKFFKMWWQHAVKWVFMVPAMAAIFWLSFEVSGSGESSVAKVILGYVLFITAVTLPMKWGGAVMQGASSFFKKATGGEWAQKKLGEKWNDAKTDVGERAGLRFQQGLWRMPGLSRVATLKAKRAIDKENMQKDVENLRKTANINALRGQAGTNKANLAEQEKKLADREGAVLAEKEITAFAKVAKERLKAEFEKREQESLRNRAQGEARIEFISTGKEDENTKKLVDRVYNASFEEKRASQEMELQESIKVGGVARDKLEILRAADNYRRHLEEYQSLSDEDKQSAQGASLLRAVATEKKSFNALKASEKYSAEYGSLDIDNVAGQLKRADTAEGRTWKATLGQGRKIFNDGVIKQSELMVKEGSVGEMQRDMDDFLDKFKDFGDRADDMKELFFQGKTAQLQMEIDKFKEIKPDFKLELRDGLVATEAMKKVMTMTGDYRHADLLKAVNGYTERYNKQNHRALDENQLNKREYRREAAFRELTNGVFSGVPDARLQREFVQEQTHGQQPTPTTQQPAPPPTFSQEDLDWAQDHELNTQGPAPTVRGTDTPPTESAQAQAEEDADSPEDDLPEEEEGGGP